MSSSKGFYTKLTFVTLQSPEFPELTHQPGLPLGEAVAGPRVLKFEMGEITVEYFLFIDLKNNLQMSLVASILTKTTWE